MYLHDYRTHPGMSISSPLSHVYHTRAPHAQRDLGSISPCFHTQKALPASPARPWHSRQTCARSKRATEHLYLTPCSHTRNAGLDYPNNTTPRPPPLSRLAAHAGTHARAQQSAVSLRAHSQSLSVSPGQTEWNRQTDRQEKNRSAKRLRGAATKTAEISAILTRTPTP